MFIVCPSFYTGELNIFCNRTSLTVFASSPGMEVKEKGSRLFELTVVDGFKLTSLDIRPLYGVYIN